MFKLAFIITEDWFLASHFLPMVRAAQKAGCEVVAICRVRHHKTILEQAGIRLISLEAERSSLNPMRAGTTAGQMAAILKQEKPDIVHCIALRSILLGGFAAILAGIKHRVFAPTGLGFLGARKDIVGKFAQSAIRFLIRSILANNTTRFIFENLDDVKMLGLNSSRNDVLIVGGAGIDPDQFRPEPLPALPPLKVAVVARMVWSKGIDVAVEAVRLAHAKGADVTLSLYGAPDPSNPKALSEQQLKNWSNDFISWHGPVAEAAKIWPHYHVCCLPSRGGEGLPRTLLEGAACGRALVTTDVPGCRQFVENGVQGFVVPPDNARALADAFIELAQNSDLVVQMGQKAREKVINGYTEKDITDNIEKLYRNILTDQRHSLTG